MNRASATVLQVVIALVGLGALVLLLWEPHLEGRNAHATVSEIYVNDPFLAYVYVGSIPMFVGLYQALKVVGQAGRGAIRSSGAVRSLRTIKRCALVVVGFVVAGLIYIVASGGSDDRAGGVVIGLVLVSAAIAVATAAAILVRRSRPVLR